MDTRSLDNIATHNTAVKNLLRVIQPTVTKNNNKHIYNSSIMIAKPHNINLSMAKGSQRARNFQNDLSIS